MPYLGNKLFSFLGGGGEGKLAERKLGGPWEDALKNFEIFIPEITTNA